MAWFPVASWLNAAGVEVIRVKGQRVKALRKYLSEHAKTDLADAHLLGAMPSIGQLRLEPLHPQRFRRALHGSDSRHAHRAETRTRTIGWTNCLLSTVPVARCSSRVRCYGLSRREGRGVLGV